MSFVIFGLVPAARSQETPEDLVYPPHSVVHGKTLMEWGAIWWQWGLSIPADRNPMLELDGRFCDVGQLDEVWFLAGALLGTADPTQDGIEKRCTVPAGREILLTIVNCFGFNGPGEDFSIEEFRTQCANLIDDFRVGELTIDGRKIPNLRAHREAFQGYQVYLPPGNVFGIPTRNPDTGRSCYGPAVSDGLYVMLKPLFPGEYIIVATGGEPPITYHLTVEEMAPAGSFRRGEMNGDGAVNLSDAIYLLEGLFVVGGRVLCDAADIDDDGKMALTDAVVLLQWLFVGGCTLPWPGPELCGRDPTDDPLPQCPAECR